MSSLGTIAAVVGGVAALGSAGAGIYSATQAGKGGGGGPVFPINMNPAHYDLANLFGSKKAAQKIAGREAAGYTDIFGNDFKNSVMNYMNPTTLGAGGPTILDALIGNPQDYLSQFNKSLGFLDQSVDTAAEANRTGLVTSAQPAFEEALRQYIKNALPAAAETSGLGASSSGFINSQQQAAEDLFGKAALTQVDLNEAAANRRLQAAPLLQALTAGRQSLPLNLASDLTGLFNFENRKPLDTFAMLSGLGSQGPYAAPAYNPTGSGSATTAGILAGLSGFNNLGSNLSGLSSLFNSPEVNLGAHSGGAGVFGGLNG